METSGWSGKFMNVWYLHNNVALMNTLTDTSKFVWIQTNLLVSVVPRFCDVFSECDAIQILPFDLELSHVDLHRYQ